MNETNQKIRARSYSYKSNLNAKTGSFSEEGDVGMRKGRRKSDFENTNEELDGKELKRKRLDNLSVVEKVTLKL